MYAFYGKFVEAVGRMFALSLSSCSWLRRCCSLCWDCDSSNRLPGHHCCGGSVCVPEEPPWLWVWHHWLLSTQWRLSTCEHQGCQTRSVAFCTRSSPWEWAVCPHTYELGGICIIQVSRNINWVKSRDVGFIHYRNEIVLYNQSELLRCADHFWVAFLTSTSVLLFNFYLKE